MKIVIGDTAARRRRELLNQIDGKRFLDLTAAERNILLAYLCEQVGVLGLDGRINVEGGNNGAMPARR